MMLSMRALAALTCSVAHSHMLQAILAPLAVSGTLLGDA
jgi:hypothetical protein